MSYTPSEVKFAGGKSHSLQARILTKAVWKLDAKGPVYALPPGIIFFKRNKQPHILQQALLYLFIWSLASSDSLLFVGFFLFYVYSTSRKYNASLFWYCS